MSDATFGVQFYRTPEWVARQMVEDLNIGTSSKVLDPSAGDGRLLEIAKVVAREKLESRLQREIPEYVWGSHRHECKDYCAIEIDPNLQAILREKHFKVIDSDFLIHGGEFYFDFILMNPPFKDGVQHLLHAWEIAHGATIRCLLNANTIRNPYSQDRMRLLDIISEFDGEVVEMGKCFADSDRTTDVDVVMVTLRDTREEEAYKMDFEPETENGESGWTGNFDDVSVVSSDAFLAHQASYEAAIVAYKEYVLAEKKLRFYMRQVVSGTDVGVIMKESKDYHGFIREFVRKCWKNVFAKTKLSNLTTEKVQKKLEKLEEEQGVMAFNARNMKNLLRSLFGQKNQIMTECVLNAFDRIASYSWDNKSGHEGWKTNCDYKVGPRFIIGNMGNEFGIHHAYRGIVQDIEKALCFLSGKNFEEITSVVDLYEYRHTLHGKKLQSEFFEVKLYLKGSLHFKWLDDDLRERFNQLVANERFGQVPAKTKQGAYV